MLDGVRVLEGNGVSIECRLRRDWNPTEDFKKKDKNLKDDDSKDEDLLVVICRLVDW